VSLDQSYSPLHNNISSVSSFSVAALISSRNKGQIGSFSLGHCYVCRTPRLEKRKVKAMERKVCFARKVKSCTTWLRKERFCVEKAVAELGKRIPCNRGMHALKARILLGEKNEEFVSIRV